MEEKNIGYRMTRVEERVTELEEKNSITHREFYGRFEKITAAMAVTEDRYSALLNGINEIKSELAAMKDKPAKRWEAIVAAIITAIVGIVVTLAVTGKI